MLTDEELVAGFEAASLAAFAHADHVRLTIIYLSRLGHDDTLTKMYDGLRRFAAAKGTPEKFHVTMTRAWVELIASALRACPQAASPAALVAACPELLERDALLRFYSPERLEGEEARARWVEPDKSRDLRVRVASTPMVDRPF